MKLPQAPEFDSTLALLTEGYELILNRCRKLDTDVYEGRLLLQKTIFMLGQDAARIFYDGEKFQRKGAIPLRVQKTLLGIGGVQSLDDELHRHRKQMFVQQLMRPEKIEALKSLAHQELADAAKTWSYTSRMTLFPELELILCRAVCRWTAVPLADIEAKQRACDLAAMIESGGRMGPNHWEGRFARKRLEQWTARLIRAVRSGTQVAPEDGALYAIALHRDLDGELLPEGIAAVELLNILRPTVAIARFIIFGALALHEFPEYKHQIENDDEFLQMFVQEVRRFYPFSPQLTARVRNDFQWRGYTFPKGRRVILDLYGTNHDARLWENPASFNPQRFRQYDGSLYGFIPQGGGDYQIHHRCPGEIITIELMKVFMRFMTQEVTYNVPKQDLTISLAKVPTLPASGFIIERAQLIQGRTT